MRFMKHGVTMQILLAILAFSVLYVSAVQAEEFDMKNLEVKLGFTRIPDKHTCVGSDISPEIGILGINATSMAVIVDDPDAAAGSFTHWIIWNIPPMDMIPGAIPKNATVNKPIPATQGLTSFGEVGYGGPCPPPGKTSQVFLPRLWTGQDARPPPASEIRPGESNGGPRAAEGRSHGHLWKVIL